MALDIGLTEEYFYTLNPKRLIRLVKAYRKREQEEKNLQAYLNGIYVMYAVGSCLSKKVEYPHKPLDFGQTEEMSEEEKIAKTKLLFAQLEVMGSNFNRTHKKDS